MDIKLDLPDAPDVTLSTLDRAARPFCVHYDGWNLEDSVEVFNGVIGQNGELICDGDFVKLASSFSPVSFVYINEEVGICKLMQQLNYGVLLVSCKNSEGKMGSINRGLQSECSSQGITIYNTYCMSQSTIWGNILRARIVFSRAVGE